MLNHHDNADGVYRIASLVYFKPHNFLWMQMKSQKYDMQE